MALATWPPCRRRSVPLEVAMAVYRALRRFSYTPSRGKQEVVARRGDEVSNLTRRDAELLVERGVILPVFDPGEED